VRHDERVVGAERAYGNTFEAEGATHGERGGEPPIRGHGEKLGARPAGAKGDASVHGSKQEPLEVPCLGDRQHFRVIASLAEHPFEDEPPASIARGVGGHRAKKLPADVKTAREGEQSATNCQQLHRSQIDLFIARERPSHAGFRLGERRRVQHDDVESLTASLERAEVVERIRLYPLDVRESVEQGVLSCLFEGFTGLIHRHDVLCTAR